MGAHCVETVLGKSPDEGLFLCLEILVEPAPARMAAARPGATSVRSAVAVGLPGLAEDLHAVGDDALHGHPSPRAVERGIDADAVLVEI